MNQLGLDFTNTPEGVNARRQSVRAPGRKAEPARARRTDPATSQAAAARVDRFAAGHFAKILAALEQGPGTYREIAARAGLEPVAVARRMAELETAGKVKRAGERDGFTLWAKS